MRFLEILGAVIIAFAHYAPQASASVLYDNGPINGTVEGWDINQGFSVSDSFTLSQASTITGVTFGGWTDAGQTITSVDFGIVATANTYTFNGIASVTNGSAIPGAGYGAYTVRSDSFSTGSINLAAGTYYLVLGNAVASDGLYAFWDQNSGPSTATQSGAGSRPSESFQILDMTTAVPEPSTWAMIILGFAGVGVMGYRRRKNAFA